MSLSGSEQVHSCIDDGVSTVSDSLGSSDSTTSTSLDLWETTQESSEIFEMSGQSDSHTLKLYD